jgi:exonuclease III
MLLLQQCKPDNICLQETKKLVNDKIIHINGYLVHEVPASGTGLGLVMGFRKDPGLSCNMIESYDDIISSSVKGIHSNIIVGNVYRSPSPIKMKETALRVVICINKYSNKSNCLLAGDWNEILSVLTKKLLKKGIQVYTIDAPTKGTRVYQNRKRTKRPIDYGSSNNHQLIASQCCRYNWSISDHLPVEVKINLSHTDKPVEMTTIFDPKKLYEPKIAQAIKNHAFDYTGLDPINEIKIFHENLDHVLSNLKVIRVEKVRENKIFIPNFIKRSIVLKRLTDKRSGIVKLHYLIFKMLVRV